MKVSMGVRREAITLGLVLFAACSSVDKNTNSENSTGMKTVTSEKTVARQAQGEATGKILELTNQQIVVQPYTVGEGPVVMSLNAQTQIYAEKKELLGQPTELLKVGDDVRVYFNENKGAALATGISKLTNAQAKKIKEKANKAAEKLYSEATGSTQGTLEQLTSEELVLVPEGQTTGTAAMVFNEDDVWVLDEGQMRSPQVLAEGSEVRVYYNQQADGAPYVVGVEIIEADDSQAPPSQKKKK